MATISTPLYGTHLHNSALTAAGALKNRMSLGIMSWELQTQKTNDASLSVMGFLPKKYQFISWKEAEANLIAKLFKNSLLAMSIRLMKIMETIETIDFGDAPKTLKFMSIGLKFISDGYYGNYSENIQKIN